jgi:methyl-accepting chemotaxis protein
MSHIKHLPIVGKISLVLGAFAMVSIASLVYATCGMRSIDAAHRNADDHQGALVLNVARAKAALNSTHAGVANLLIAVTDEGNQRALATIKTSRAAFAHFMDEAAVADATQATTIEALKTKGLNVVDVVCEKAIKEGQAATAIADVIAAEADYLKICSPIFEPLVEEMAALGRSAEDAENAARAGVATFTERTIVVSFVALIVGVVATLVLSYLAVTAWVSRPIKDMVVTMKRLAGGHLGVVIGGLDRRDELGPMAQAVQVFKDNALALEANEAAAERQRAATEAERASNDVARAEIQRQQQAVVAALASGLAGLSRGDLQSRIDKSFGEDYEKLRADFNATIDALRDTMTTIASVTHGISAGSDQIAHASDDLSRRTEQQAASLEETAAALAQITETVKAMAGNAGEAAKVVMATRSAAETSGAVVGQAVDAMGKIKTSSAQISNIVGMIDEIAFQTNLLALNAGVEAARAGDAGRGFAVVASEVRSLAQRSAEAAKEIKVLISDSSMQVANGVALVDKTGVALKDIVSRVAEMDTLVNQISVASREQATSLAEINIAVRQMDQVVQQNAAMVEESTAAAHALKNETVDLTTMVGRFEIGAEARRPPARANPVHAAQAKLARAVASPAAPRQMMKTTAVRKVEAAPATDWEEF